MIKVLSLVALILFSACSTKNGASVHIDEKSPLHKTATIHAKGKISGIILPKSNFTQVAYTRADRRVISNNNSYDSWVVRQTLGSNIDTVIYRMDKGVRWILGNEKTYQECPLEGCSLGGLVLQENKETSEETFEYDPNEQEECSTKVTENSFNVKSTGKTKIISGFKTNQYLANWKVVYEDEKGRKDINRLNIIYWNTVPNKEMKKVWEVHEGATRAYLKKINKQSTTLSSIIPESIFSSLSAFSGDTSKKNKKWNNHINKELAKAKGYPIAIKTQWFLDRKACVEKPKKVEKKKAENKPFNWSDPLGSIQDTVADVAGESIQDETKRQTDKFFSIDPNKPIFSYEYEITSIGMESIHDSVFTVPMDYKIVTSEQEVLAK